MATIATKQYGMTAPLSSALPTEDEVKLTDALKAELRRQDNFESAEETQKRYAQRVKLLHTTRPSSAC